MSNPSNDIGAHPEQVRRFMRLFEGLNTAYGTGRGKWVKRVPVLDDFLAHLRGLGPGIGIAPLREDNTVMFAAIDLDEPDFEAAFEMQDYIPGASFVERSRSGNAHVWVFFREPCDAWVAMGILKEATLAAGKKHVEVFPKNPDFAKVNLGNYINLPYHGEQRPIIWPQPDNNIRTQMSLAEFLDEAEESKNDPNDWHKRASLMQIVPPSEQERTQEFGTQTHLHVCAQHVIEERHDNPVVAGHRSVVFFVLAKALTNCEMYDSDEAYDMMNEVNQASPDPIPEWELRRVLRNAEEKQYTSTGCDDPTFAPYASPDCPIANPRR